MICLSAQRLSDIYHNTELFGNKVQLVSVPSFIKLLNVFEYNFLNSSVFVLDESQFKKFFDFKKIKMSNNFAFSKNNSNRVTFLFNNLILKEYNCIWYSTEIQKNIFTNYFMLFDISICFPCVFDGKYKDGSNKCLFEYFFNSVECNLGIDIVFDSDIDSLISNIIHDYDIFDSVPDNYYTVQLCGSSCMKNLCIYASQQKLLNYWILKTNRNNKCWYILIYGIYSDLFSAEKVILQLCLNNSLSLHTTPWIRQIKSVKQDCGF